ncbi:PspC domain-containing protein [Virgibacillus kekensis]|uniref:PspC domain-containing protein n=1 Tax=Virgibacillus kekensis TaxID=202261 RepID=A0ABV9DMS7_9BACI
MNKVLRKSSADKSINGVCGGIAEFFGISSFGVRLIFIFLPANLIIYIILANTMHESPPIIVAKPTYK